MKKIKKNIIGLVVAIVILVLTGLIGVLTDTFKDVKSLFKAIDINGKTIIGIIIMITFMFCINYLLQLFFELIKKITKNSRTKTVVNVVSSFVRWAVVLIVLCWGLSIVGVNLSTIFASVGIIALIVGFGAESLVADVITGIFIMFENQFNIGDIIEIDGFRGTVETIGIRTITIRDSGYNIKIINNSDLKNIVNRSSRGSVAVSDITVSYDVDLNLLEQKMPQIIEAIRKGNENIFIGRIEYLGVENFNSGGIQLKFIANVSEENVFSGRRLLNKELKCAFDRENIEFACKQIQIQAVEQ